VSQPANRQPVPVGKFFLEQGKITQQQLELALKHRSEFNVKLGQSLVELGFVTETDMVEALRYQARFPCVHLTPGIVEARVARKVGEPVSRRLRALALNQFAGHTTVALEDPSNEVAIEELSHLLATRILAVYAEPSAIRRLQDQVFSSSPRPAAARPVATAPAEPRAPRRPESAPQGEAPVEAVAEPSAVPEAPDERAVIERVRAILLLAFEQGVERIHFEPRREELVVRFRLDGALVQHARLPAGWTQPTLTCLRSLTKLEEGQPARPRTGSVPFVFKKRRYEVRIATLPTDHGESAVLRVRDAERPHPRLSELGLSEEQRTEMAPLLAAERGLLLVAGPPESGRRTTLRALLEKFASPTRKVAALDENDEPGVDGVLHARLDPSVGLDFARGAEALLAQDPDVLLVGEIDGRETARTLVRAGLARRVVLSTLFARDALDALGRLQRLGIEPYLLAEAVRGILAQRLVRQICPDCTEPVVPSPQVRAALELGTDERVFRRGEGCPACSQTGFRGQLRLFEVLSLTPGLRRELEKGSGPEALARVAVAEGFRPLRLHGIERAAAGLTTLEEVLAATGGI
jgi:type IV pilus assembly protein PilB